MPVLATVSILDTARWCRLLLAQITDDPAVFIPDSEGAGAAAMSSFTAALNTVKKGNKTAIGTAQAMLSAVPGLGPKRVQALLAEKSIADLVLLSQAEIAALVVGGKRLGDILALSLYACVRSKI